MIQGERQETAIIDSGKVEKIKAALGVHDGATRHVKSAEKPLRRVHITIIENKTY